MINPHTSDGVQHTPDVRPSPIVPTTHAIQAVSELSLRSVDPHHLWSERALLLGQKLFSSHDTIVDELQSLGRLTWEPEYQADPLGCNLKIVATATTVRFLLVTQAVDTTAIPELRNIPEVVRIREIEAEMREAESLEKKCPANMKELLLKRLALISTAELPEATPVALRDVKATAGYSIFSTDGFVNRPSRMTDGFGLVVLAPFFLPEQLCRVRERGSSRQELEDASQTRGVLLRSSNFKEPLASYLYQRGIQHPEAKISPFVVARASKIFLKLEEQGAPGREYSQDNIDRLIQEGLSPSAQAGDYARAVMRADRLVSLGSNVMSGIIIGGFAWGGSVVTGIGSGGMMLGAQVAAGAVAILSFGEYVVNLTRVVSSFLQRTRDSNAVDAWCK